MKRSSSQDGSDGGKDHGMGLPAELGFRPN